VVEVVVVVLVVVVRVVVEVVVVVVVVVLGVVVIVVVVVVVVEVVVVVVVLGVVSAIDGVRMTYLKNRERSAIQTVVVMIMQNHRCFWRDFLSCRLFFWSPSIRFSSIVCWE
jgi:hypothetical protein